MSQTINFVDQLLITARRMLELGRGNDAFTRFARLSRFRDLPAEVAAECHLSLGELLLRRGKPNRARRHFQAALRQVADHARAHHLLADALQAKALPDPLTALDHYRKALTLEPNQAECLCAAGRLAVEVGLNEEGLGYLRKAATLALDDVVVLRKVVDGLLLANEAGEARRMVRVALFRNTCDRRFQALWNHVQFQQIRKEQGESQARQTHLDETGPVLLSFANAAEVKPVPRKNRVIRHDAASALGGPHRDGVVARLPRHRYAR